MTKRELFVATVLLAFVGPASARQAQTPAAKPPQAAAHQPAAPATSAPPAPTPSTAAAAAADSESPGFTYNPEGRRDPFVSLLRRGGAGAASAAGTIRPAGLAGLEAAEVTLRGTIQSQSGYVGILQGSDNKTYIVRAGDRLLDGTVRSVTANALVILQQVNDPLSLEKQREVRKVLRQTDEAK